MGDLRRSHGSSGNQITKGLIGDFLADVSIANDNLEALTYLGQLESRKTQDAYTSDLARVYVSATPQTRAQLVEARKDVAQGYKLFRESRIDESTQLFTRARSVFEKAGERP